MIPWMNPYEIGGSLFSYTPERTEGRFMTLTYTMCECPIRERQEFVQFYVSGNKLKHLSVSKEPLEDMMRFFPDFDTLDRTELHLRIFLDPEEDACGKVPCTMRNGWKPGIRSNSTGELPLSETTNCTELPPDQAAFLMRKKSIIPFGRLGMPGEGNGS